MLRDTLFPGTLVLLLALSVTAPSCGQTPPSRNGVRDLVARWSRQVSGFDTSKPTVVFTTADETCTTCAGTKIEFVADAIRTDSLDVNVLVVASVMDTIEVRPLRRMMRGADVLASTSPEEFQRLHPSMAWPSMVLIDTSGTIVAVYQDIRTMAGLSDSVAVHLVGTQPTAGGAPGVIPNLNLIPDPNAISSTATRTAARYDSNVSMIPLDESEEVVMEMYSPVYDAAHDRLLIADSRQYIFDAFSMRTGRLLDATNFGGYGAFFRRGNVDSLYWSIALRMPSTVKILGIVRPRAHSAPKIVAGMITGFKQEGFHGTRPFVMAIVNNAVLDIDDTTVISVTRLKQSRYIPGSPYGITRNGQVICHTAWSGAYDSTVSSWAHCVDSCAVIGIIDASRQIRPVLFTRMVPTIGGGSAIPSPHPASVVALSGDRAVYIAPHFGIGAIVSLGANGDISAVSPFDSSGALAKVCSPHSGIVIRGARIDSAEVVLYFSSASGGHSTLLIDRYTFRGHLIEQRTVVLPDYIHEFHVIPNTDALLIHFDRLRWQIVRIAR